MGGYRKYNTSKIKNADGVFDSQKEYSRYVFLKQLQDAGKIQNLQRQVPFELVPVQREPDQIGKRGGIKKGKVIEQAVKYYADFVYEQDGKTVVEDSKGVRTTDYIIKRKLMLYLKGIRIREV